MAIVDYGVGNLRSVANMIAKADGQCQLVSDPEALRSFSKILLPGVGHFRAGMEQLQQRGFVEVLGERAKEGACVLGICLGMQLLLESSEEGDCKGLGLVRGHVRKFNFGDDSPLKVPHVGFNLVRFGDHPVAKGLPQPSKFYFTHSYYATCDNPQDVLGTTEYGQKFVSAFASGNILGCQFHPEKSHQFGLAFMRNFLEYKCS